MKKNQAQLTTLKQALHHDNNKISNEPVANMETLDQIRKSTRWKSWPHDTKYSLEGRTLWDVISWILAKQIKVTVNPERPAERPKFVKGVQYR